MSVLSQLKHARVFGHPIHAMLVHFPSALFPMSLFFDIGAYFLQNTCLACASFYSLGAGILFGFAATLVGSIDYARLPATHAAWNKASLHALLSVTWLVLFAIVFGLKLKQNAILALPTIGQIVLSTVGVMGLIFSNFLGGDLIFRHKVGFEE